MNIALYIGNLTTICAVIRNVQNWQKHLIPIYHTYRFLYSMFVYSQYRLLLYVQYFMITNILNSHRMKPWKIFAFDANSFSFMLTYIGCSFELLLFWYFICQPSQILFAYFVCLCENSNEFCIMCSALTASIIHFNR